MNTTLTVLSAGLVGLLGSVHCVGMCGGIAGSLSSLMAASAKTAPWQMLLAYNVGRVSSYMIAGALAGGLGSTALAVFSPDHVAAVGLTLSGLFMLAFGLYLSGWWQALAAIEKLGLALWQRIGPWSRHLLPVHHTGQALALGALWGWLPCGLVYATLIWSLANADPLRGAVLMGAFGLGTLPLLIAIGSSAYTLTNVVRQKRVRQFAGTLVMLFGMLTLFGVVRPVHLGNHPIEKTFCGPDFLLSGTHPHGDELNPVDTSPPSTNFA